MSISTHVLDTARGCPASGIPVTLERQEGEAWRRVGAGETDGDGRVRDLAPGDTPAGVYRVRFALDGHLGARGFFPYAQIVFRVDDGGGHYHVPLLLSPFGYTTYRGS